MSNCGMLCRSCRNKIRSEFPCGKVIYIGKKEPLDHQRLSRLLKKRVPMGKLALKFDVTVRRIQQIASSLNIRG